jgi:hypothetical protein
MKRVTTVFSRPWRFNNIKNQNYRLAYSLGLFYK